MSKGTERRPASVDAFELERRWNRTFGRGQLLNVSDVEEDAGHAEDPADGSAPGAATPIPTGTARTDD